MNSNTVEYLFTKPYTRGTIVGAKLVAGLLNILTVGIVTIVMSLLAMLPVTNDATVYGQVFLAGIGMIFTQCGLPSLQFKR